MPTWNTTVNIKKWIDWENKDGLTLLQRADGIREEFNRKGMLSEDDFELWGVCDELIDAGEAEDVEWFDDVLGGIYDYCDRLRIWTGP